MPKLQRLDLSPTWYLGPALLSVSPSYTPTLPRTLWSGLAVAGRHPSFFLKSLVLPLCSPPGGKSSCCQGKGSFWVRWHLCPANISRRLHRCPFSGAQRGAGSHERQGENGFSLTPCHLSSPGPRRLCLVSESPTVAPAQAHQRVVLIPHRLPCWAKGQRRTAFSPLSSNPFLPEMKVT